MFWKSESYRCCGGFHMLGFNAANESLSNTYANSALQNVRVPQSFLRALVHLQNPVAYRPNQNSAALFILCVCFQSSNGTRNLRLKKLRPRRFILPMTKR
jgi:hypothetical protein